jgi:DNA-binding NarL/FixJ family response regulator
MKNIKFIIVDDSEKFRQALKDYLVTEFSSLVIAEASNGTGFLNLDVLFQADIIIMDLFMPDMNGLEVTQSLLWKYPYLKVIAVTMHADKAYLKQLLETGFKGCIFKSNIFDEVKIAVDHVMNNKLYFPKYINL